MASTLLNAVIQAPIYQINSGPQVDRTQYPYGMTMLFGSGASVIQPNTAVNGIQDIQAGRTAGAALVYTRIKSSATGDTVFYSSLTVAQILTAMAT